MTTCNAENDRGVRCWKAPHDEDEQHWGLTSDGRDVVWLSVTLAPPKRLHVARYGPREYAKACDRARDNVGDGTNMTHVVEVFDEETERDEREGVDLGVLYVVEYKHLDEFLGQHAEAEVQETFGFTLEED